MMKLGGLPNLQGLSITLTTRFPCGGSWFLACMCIQICASSRQQKTSKRVIAGERMIADFIDLQRLSGRLRPGAVKKWLQRQGIVFMLDADGKPVTTEKALNEALLRGRKTEPNWPARKRQ